MRYIYTVMLFYVALLLTTCIVDTVSAKGVQFMDCPGNDGGLGLTRKCCKSDQLPKGCECYDISSNSDYTNTLLHKPKCPADMNVIFYLYTRDHRTTAETIKAGEANIKSTSYKGAKKTVFIAHGFTDKGTAAWCIELKNALLDLEDMNVVIVDWQQGAKGPNYFQATANTRPVGSMVARLIQDLNTYAKSGFENFHLIGHSLGAHLMGYAGKEVFRLTNQRVGRISGLDPAGPNFEKMSKFVRIDSTDAQFVDIMHTDAEPLINGGFGMRLSVGHVDFYPNGGVNQPGCPKNIFDIDSLILVEEKKFNLKCSHVRAIDYFTNSIHRCRYNPPDGNTACTMGYHVNRSCRGEIRPKTTSQAPYC